MGCEGRPEPGAVVDTSALFPELRSRRISGTFVWAGQEIYLYLLHSSYQLNLSSHVTLTDIDADDIVGKSNQLTGLAINNGWADSDPALFENLVVDDEIPHGVLAMVEGDPNNPLLLAYFLGRTGFPLTPVGHDYVVWHRSDRDGWFAG